MSTVFKKELSKLCAEFSTHPEWVQGGGGNVSVKETDDLMIIKASGFAFRDISENKGLVSVNYSEVKNYFLDLKAHSSDDIEKQSSDFILKQTQKNLSELFQRPSIETGFHSFLSKYVIHSHSVFVNALTCSVEGEMASKEIFKNAEFKFFWVPYANPGYNLTVSIAKAVSSDQGNSDLPAVFFLQNHGIIVTAGNLQSILDVYKHIDARLRIFLREDQEYPVPRIEAVGGRYISATNWLKNYAAKNILDQNIFSKIIFPDQIVYLNNAICFCVDESCKKRVHLSGNSIVYLTSKKEALTIEETLVTYFYILDLQQRTGLHCRGLSVEDVKYINNMDSEKYRQDLLNK